MNTFIQPKNALISVFYKDGLGPIVEELSRLGVTIYSTGGTQSFIEDLGTEVKRVEDMVSPRKTHPAVQHRDVMF